MYVCLCNALSDVQIGLAVEGGARRPRDVYAACGSQAQCGGCTKTVLGIIRTAAAAGADIQSSQER